MLSRRRRLPRPLFSDTADRGRIIHTDFATLRALGAKESRFSVVVGKKVASRAHKRNLIRRRIYSIIESFYISRPVRAIVFTKKKAAESTFRDMKEEVRVL